MFLNVSHISSVKKKIAASLETWCDHVLPSSCQFVQPRICEGHTPSTLHLRQGRTLHGRRHAAADLVHRPLDLPGMWLWAPGMTAIHGNKWGPHFLHLSAGVTWGTPLKQFALGK